MIFKVVRAVGSRIGRVSILFLIIVWLGVVQQGVAAETYGCGGSYALKVASRQQELIDVYRRAIERGQEKEVMSKLDNCLKQLAEVFKKRVKIPDWPSSADIYEAAKAILVQAADKVCQIALSSVKREEQEWKSVWDSATTLGSSQSRRATDWQLIWQQSEIGNRTISSVVTKRLRDILR